MARQLPPGCHPYLPRGEINAAMRRYLQVDGWYLLRPSFTSPGQYSICVSYQGEVKNFKINCDDLSGQYSVSSKKFDSLDELLDAYSKNPFRSKRGGTEIYLKHPIPVDKDLEQRHMLMQNEENQAASMNQPQSGPGPGPRLPPRNNSGPGPGVTMPLGSRGGAPSLPENGRPSGRPLPSPGGNATPGRHPAVGMTSMSPGPPLPTRQNVGPAPAAGRRPLPSTPGVVGRPQPAPHGQVEEQPTLPLRRGQESQSGTPPPLPARQSSESRRGDRPRSERSVSSELAPGWEEFFSEEHKRPYFHHAETSRTVWVRPVAPQPSPTPARTGGPRPLPHAPSAQVDAAPGVPTRGQPGPAAVDAPPLLPHRSSLLADQGSRRGGGPRGRPASGTTAVMANDIPPPVSRRGGAPPPVGARISSPNMAGQHVPSQHTPSQHAPSQHAPSQHAPSQHAPSQDEGPPPPLPTSSRRGRGAPPMDSSHASTRAPLPAVPPAGSGRSALPPVPGHEQREAPPPLPVSDMPPVPVSHAPPVLPTDFPPAPEPFVREPVPPVPSPTSMVPEPIQAPIPVPPPAPVAAPAPPPPGPPPPPGNAPPPPGPPPPPADVAAPSLGGIGASLSAGRAALKKAEPVQAADNRGDLLSSIRGGINLKKASDAPPPKALETDGGLMNSLMSAVGTRRAAIGDESDDGDMEEVEDDDDW